MSKQSSPRFKKSMPLGSIALVVLFVGLAVFGGYFFVKYQNVNTKYKEVTMTSEDKIKRAVTQVSGLYNVPKYEDEQPSVPGVEGSGIYTVQDSEVESLKKNNSFFADAKTGDTLVAYKKSNIAILYRPSENKIIKLGSYAEAALVKTAIGIIASGDVSKSIESKMNEKFPNQISVTVTEPSTNTVTKGIVVDVSGKGLEAAKQIAGVLGYDIGQLPAGEKTPEGSTIVIVAPNAVAPTQ